MSTPRRSPGDRWTIGGTLIVSVLLHALVLVPVLFRSASAGSAAVRASISDLAVLPPDVPDERRPFEPGIDQSRAVTIAWIGYEAYEEHLARLAEVDQAAFTPEPGDEAAEPAMAASTDSFGGEERARAEEDASDAVLLDRDGVPVEGAEASAPAIVDHPEALARAMRRMAVDLWNASMLEGGRESDSDGAEGAEGTDSETEERADANGDEGPNGAGDHEPDPEQASESSEAGTEEPREGALRDLESEAASTIDLRRDQLHPGRPVAREGLELFPRQPVFTMLTRMTALPRNPIVEIRFGIKGIPVEAEVLRSSGNRAVDDAVLSSLFRWRAQGPALADLADGETADIRIRMILNPYARD